MTNNSIIHPKITRGSYMSSENWIQTKSISVRRISGGLKYYQKILKDLGELKRRVKTRVESDWKEYYGSNKEVQILVERKGTTNYERVIVKLCKTKGEMSYYEAKLQFENDVLLSDDYYNEFIGCKIHSKHIRRK